MATAVLVACGGGGGGGDAAPATSAAGTALAGKVMDGYLQGATVCFDENANLRCDAGELSASTAADGGYRLTVPAERLATLARVRFIADVPATAVDAATGLPVGEDHVLLAQPFDAASGTYHFTPLGTLVEQAVLGGADRGAALAEAKRAAGLTQLSPYDDYVAAASGPYAAEAARARARAVQSFPGQTRQVMEAFASPSASLFEDRAAAGTFLIYADNGSPTSVNTIFKYTLGAADVQGVRQESVTVWNSSPAAPGGYAFLSSNGTRDDFLDEATGWIHDAVPGGRQLKLVGNRMVETRNGLAIAVEMRGAVDLSGKPIQRGDFGGSADITPSGTYPGGARAFPALAAVQLRSGGYALPFVVTQPNGIGADILNFDDFVSAYQYQSIATGPWWSVSVVSVDTSITSVEIAFQGAGSAVVRHGATQELLGTGSVGFVTFGGQRLLRITLADDLSTRLFGETGGHVDFTDYGGVRQFELVRAGEVTAVFGSRALNRAAADAILQMLGLPPFP